VNKFFIISFLSLLIIFSPGLRAQNDDVCGTISGDAPPYIPTSGVLRVFVIFAQFKDDPQIENNGWAKNSYPTWANTFVNAYPSEGERYAWNNLSQYFNEMSNGTFQVLGDVYNSLVITDNNESYYSTIGQVNREIIMKVDPYVNFAVYDNLNGNLPGTDGIVDFIYIIYRNASDRLMNYTGKALLNVSATLYVDGKRIINNTDIGGGVQQQGGYNGRDYTLYVAAHELGHYFFGSGHIDFVSNLALMTDLPVWNSSRGMHSFERYKLGWISYTDITTDGEVTMTDYMTTDQVCRVPISNNEYFLIENRKRTSPHDKAGDIDFYIYRILYPELRYPWIDVLCADGNWNFNVNTSNHTLTRTTPNKNGKDEMNFYQEVAGFKYACYIPVYHEDAAWGDTEDAFDLTFNNVLSPASNPHTYNWGPLSFTIEVIGSNTIQFYFTDPYAGKPAKPQNLQVSSSVSNNPLLTWNANSELDLTGYSIDRAEGTGAGLTWESGIAQTSSTSYVDYDVALNPVFEDEISYRIRAYDSLGKYSVYSEIAWIGDAVLHKYVAGADINFNFYLDNAFPNPFNPSTNINYEIPKDGMVTLKVFNILGSEVKTLVSDFKTRGKYRVVFDAKNLPSGLYIYELISGNYKVSKKLLLMK